MPQILQGHRHTPPLHLGRLQIRPTEQRYPHPNDSPESLQPGGL